MVDVKKIQIMVATHKIYEFPNDLGYFPLQVGAAISTNRLSIQGDDCGESISQLNRSFCELTGLYWVWKNTTSDIVGLVHYRRYFVSPNSSLILKGKPVASSEDLIDILDAYDVVLAKPRNYWIDTVWSHYKNAHFISDLEVVKSILVTDYPDYVSSFEKVTASRKVSLYNMFVMRRSDFDKYCCWLFDILFKVKQIIPYERYGNYQGRVFGFLGERLLNVWITRHVRSSKICYLPVVNLDGESLALKAVGLLKRKTLGIKPD
jgi:hypothetical protein